MTPSFQDASKTGPGIHNPPLEKDSRVILVRFVVMDSGPAGKSPAPK
jgi:hypothetical protein